MAEAIKILAEYDYRLVAGREPRDPAHRDARRAGRALKARVSDMDLSLPAGHPGHRARRVRPAPRDQGGLRGGRHGPTTSGRWSRLLSRRLSVLRAKSGSQVDEQIYHFKDKARPGHRAPVRPHRGDDAQRRREEGPEAPDQARLLRRGLAVRRAAAREVQVVLPVGRRDIRGPDASSPTPR